MKNVSRLLLLLVVISLFPACNNSIVSIQKRQYRKGYEINFGGRADIPKNNSRDKKEILKSDEAVNDEVCSLSGDTGSATDRKDVLPDSGLKSNSNNPERTFFKAMKGPVIKAIYFPSLKKNTTSLTDNNSQSGLIKNLVWFAIVILLLAYIVAISSGGLGLGASVHLLLIAALILLFLKLITPL